MTLPLKFSLLLGLIVMAGSVRADAPLLYLPFDGDCRAAVSEGATTPTNTVGLQFREGLRGRAVHIAADCRFPAAGCFDPHSGTIGFWLRPSWPGNQPTPRCLFSLYGGDKSGHSWLRNRWNITADAGTLRFALFDDASEKPQVLTGSIAEWQSGQWHHVAVTWDRLGSGRKDAGLMLYVDGRAVNRVGDVRIDIGAVGPLLDIGRDSDQSPDYAEADYDEFYIYGRALSEAEIRQAIGSTRQPPKTSRAARVVRTLREDWRNSTWPLRCRVTLPPVAEDVTAAVVRLPWDVSEDLVALRQNGCVDPDSIRVVPRGQGSAPLPAVLGDDGLLWRMSGKALHDPSSVDVYFGLVEVDASMPLYVQTRRHAWGHAPATAALVEPDYAKDTFGKAWDFDQNDFTCIDGWGNRPEFIHNRLVKNGILSFDASGDPYFIFGNLWDPDAQSPRPVAVDLAKYPMLKMRIRQNHAAAMWGVMGRFGKAPLTRYDFKVKGTDWQTVRVDLAKAARWSGTMNALRIDPPKNVNTHVEIDWIRLTNEVAAHRQAVEMLPTDGHTIATLELKVEDLKAVAGSRQTVAVLAKDEDGRPTVGQPVIVWLADGSHGRLLATASRRSLEVDARTRRGVTDRDGRVMVELETSRTAGAAADRVGAMADLIQSTPVTKATIDSIPGPAHHYAIAFKKPVCVDAAKFPLVVEVQLVDRYDNPVPIANRKVQLSTNDGGAVAPDAGKTDAQGRIAASLQVDPTKRWGYRIVASDEAGVKGRSAPISVVFPQPRTDGICLAKSGYFVRGDGRPFVPLGGFYANWVQDATPNGEWGKITSFTYTSDEDKVRWMKFLHENGVTAMRLMLRTHHPNNTTEPMDLGGRVNQALLAEAIRYTDLGRRFDLQFQLVVHEDYTKPVYINDRHFELYTLPAFEGEKLDALPAAQRRFVRDRRLDGTIEEKYADPDVIACQDLYVRELLPALRGNPQVFAYELENEMVGCPLDWANHAIATIRELDPKRLVCVSHGGGGLLTADPVWWQRGAKIDFYNPHLYPDEATSKDIDYGAAVSLLTRYGRMAGPSFLGESSGDQFCWHPNVAARRWVMRDIIWMSLTGGSPGVFFWNARGPEVQEFKLAKEAMEQLDLANFRRAKPEIGIDVRHPLKDGNWFQTPEGRRAYATMGRYVQHYLSEGVDFDFTLTPDQYSQSATLAQFAPPKPRRRLFASCEGWQASYLADADGHETLLYVRNYAGSERWLSNGEQTPRGQQLRTRAVRPLKVQSQMEGSFRVSICDLDEKTIRQTTLESPGTIDLGATDHDFAMVFKRNDSQSKSRSLSIKRRKAEALGECLLLPPRPSP